MRMRPPFRVLPAVSGALVFACLLAPPSGVAQDGAAGATPMSGYRTAHQLDRYRGDFADLAIEIDRYWADVFVAAGAFYRSPGLVAVDRPIDTACGPIEPEPNASYCRADFTIYLTPSFLADQQAAFGDYAPVAILAHEWGHHVQALLGIRHDTTKAQEGQADCLMGAFTARADELGFLDAGDFLEALATALDSGDPVALPEDYPGAHGSAEERVKSLTKGFGGGPVHGCGLPLGQRPTPAAVPAPGPRALPTTTPTPAVTSIPAPPRAPAARELLPTAPALAHAPCFFLVEEGALDFPALLGRFAGVPGAAEHLSALGWQDGAYRQFGCDGPPAGAAGWIDISVHVFVDDASARAAVPYFAEARIAGTSLGYDEAPQLGDARVAVSGAASNGWEYTLYASKGPVLVRVTGVSPLGEPDGDVAAVVADVLARVPAGVLSTQPTPKPQAAAPTPTPAADPRPVFEDCFPFCDND
jgi:uncharacterized protein